MKKIFLFMIAICIFNVTPLHALKDEMDNTPGVQENTKSKKKKRTNRSESKSETPMTEMAAEQTETKASEDDTECCQDDSREDGNDCCAQLVALGCMVAVVGGGAAGLIYALGSSIAKDKEAAMAINECLRGGYCVSGYDCDDAYRFSSFDVFKNNSEAPFDTVVCPKSRRQDFVCADPKVNPNFAAGEYHKGRPICVDSRVKEAFQAYLQHMNDTMAKRHENEIPGLVAAE